jgi:uncharacterized protein (UPF0335 family)
MQIEIDNFLRSFEGKSISIENLSQELKLSNKEVKEFFTDSSKYYESKEIHNFYIKRNDNSKDRREPLALFNRYYKSDLTKGDIYLTELLTGQEVFKGSVDYSDIGGLYSSVFTVKGDYGNEIERYSRYSIESLFCLFENESFVIENKAGGITVSIPKRNISCSTESFFISFVNCIKELEKCEEFYVIQYIEGDDEYAYDNSKLFYSKESALDFLNDLKKERNVNYKIIKTK